MEIKGKSGIRDVKPCNGELAFKFQEMVKLSKGRAVWNGCPEAGRKGAGPCREVLCINDGN